MSDGGTESEGPRESIAEKRGAGPTFASALLCVLAGVAAGGRVWWGEPFGAALIGVIYGIVVGFCGFLFAIFLAFLITLPFAKRAPKVSDGVFMVLLVGAPVLAWFVVVVTLQRLV